MTTLEEYIAVLAQTIAQDRDKATALYVKMLVKLWKRDHAGATNFALLLNTSHIVSLMNIMGMSAVQAEKDLGLTILRCEIQHPTLAKLY